MARIAREAQFSPDEIVIVHVVNRAVRRVFLMGQDKYSGINFDYRKVWFERRLEQLAAFFGIDLLAFSILSNHIHLILRQRPDLVQSWDDTEVARRWLMLCPKKRNKDGSACCPTEAELNSIRDDDSKLREIRSRLSDISWWMRLMCQTIAQRINREDLATGKVFENRYRAVRLLDEASLLACAAYVDLNPIRAAMAETLEQSDYTSVQRRIQAVKLQLERTCLGGTAGIATQAVDSNATTNEVDIQQTEQTQQSAALLVNPTISTNSTSESEVDQVVIDQAAADQLDQAAIEPDRILAPVELNELRDAVRLQPSQSGCRCSDRGFLNMTAAEYIELLDWTARTLTPGKRGTTPADAPSIFERMKLGISVESWCELVGNFGRLFKIVAGKPHVVDAHRGKVRPKRFKLSREARQLLTA